MKTIEYKGFQAAVEFEDGALFVRVLHIDDLLVAQCESVHELQDALKELVDAYVDDCKELGKEPQKSFSGSFNVRVGPELHKKAAFAAAEQGLGLNAWMIEAAKEKAECASLKDRLRGVVGEVQKDFRNDLRLLQMAQPRHSRAGGRQHVRMETYNFRGLLMEGYVEDERWEVGHDA